MGELRIIRSSVLILIVSLTSIAFGQKSDNGACYEVLYLDFFGLVGVEVPKWTESETEGLTELVLKKQQKDSSLNVSFVLPIIAYELQEFHPNCTEIPDTNYLARIMDVYFLVRQQNQDVFLNYSIEQKIDFIRDDFYELVKVDENLMKMSFTMDDGPFYGIDTEEQGAISQSLETSFGELIISSFEESNVISAMDKNGALIWRKIITGLADRNLGEITTSDNPLKETSLATRVYLNAGERLTLYVKNDGQFMYYFHSW